MSDRDYLCRGCPSGSPWVFLTFSRTRFLIFLREGERSSGRVRGGAAIRLEGLEFIRGSRQEENRAG